jgi:alanine racemase
MNSKDTTNFKENVLRQSWIEIDLDAVAENVRNIRKHIGTINYVAVVKANAYGLGVVPVAKTIMENGADRLALVTLEECIELRNAGIDSPLFNMGPIFPNQASIVVENDIEQMAYRLDEIKALSEAASKLNKTAKIHFKINTGMNRYGENDSKALESFGEIRKLPNIDVVGVMTHFPMSDELDKSFALLQIERFKEFKANFEKAGYNIPFWHMGNSGAVLDLPQAHFNLVRIGLMNYGYWPSSQVRRPFVLIPAMHVKSRIVEIRTVQRGDTVGYGRRFLAEKEERIGVLPMGYADGYDRKIRVGGYVLINGQQVPIVSGLCMDAFFIKLTDFPDIEVGETVTIMGIDNGQEISPHDIAKLTETVSYEVISNFGRRLPRVYIKNGEICEIDNKLLP